MESVLGWVGGSLPWTSGFALREGRLAVCLVAEAVKIERSRDVASSASCHVLLQSERGKQIRCADK